MSELDGTRARIIKALKPLHAISVENSVGPGTPDVNYIEGWIELKWMRSWPARPNTLVKIPHYNKEQRLFAVNRRRRGGTCWLLLQVRDQWLLFDGAVAAVVINRATAKQLHDAAHRVWPQGLDEKELLECVSQMQKPYTFSAADWEKHKEQERKLSRSGRSST